MESDIIYDRSFDTEVQGLITNIWKTFPSAFVIVSQSLKNETDNCWEKEVNIIAKFARVRKILNVLLVFPDVYLQTCKQIVPNLSQILHNFFDSKSENSSRTASENYKNVIPKLLEVVCEVLDNLSKLNDKNVTDESLCETAKAMLLRISKFITQPEEEECLAKPLFQRYLQTCQKCWNYLKIGRPTDLEEIIPDLMQIVVLPFNFAVHNVNGAMFIRFALELCQQENVSLVSLLLNTIPRTTSTFISFLATMVQFANTTELLQFVLGEAHVVEEVRGNLLSEFQTQRKQATFVLKSLTSVFAENPQYLEHPLADDSELLLHIGQPEFIKFWTNFFDLYEILDEKQIHIIEPYLPKLQDFKLDLKTYMPWYFIILSKMLNHDNRCVAKEGLIHFLESGNLLKRDNCEKIRKRMERFIDVTLFPVLKEHVGWILSEADEFFRCANMLGEMLNLLYQNEETGEFLASNKVLQFIINVEKGLSPHCLFFLTNALHHGVTVICQNQENIMSDLYKECFTGSLILINKCLTYTLITVDKFLRSEIEKYFVDIFIALGRCFHKNCYTNFMEFPLQDPVLVLQMMSFFGGLSLSVFCEAENVQNLAKFSHGSGTYSVDNTFSLTSNLDTKLMNCVKYYTNTQVRGLFRWLLMASLNLNLSEKLSVVKSICCCSEHIEKEHFSPAVALATTDFFKCLQLMLSRCQFKEEKLKCSVAELQATIPTNEVTDRLECIFDIIQQDVTLEDFLIALKIFISSESICVNGNDALRKFTIDLVSRQSQSTRSQFFENNRRNFLICKMFHFTTNYAANYINVDPPYFTPELLTPEGFKRFFIAGDVSSDLAFCSNTGTKFYFSVTGNQLCSEFYQLKFMTFAKLLRNWSNTDICDIEFWRECIAAGLNQIDLAGLEGILSATEFFIAIIPYVKHFDDKHINKMLQDFINVSWKQVFELRKTESFWDGIRLFVSFITQPYFLNQDIMIEYTEKIFQSGDTIMGLPFVLVERLSDFQMFLDFEDTQAIQNVIKVCVRATWLGPPMLKNHKVDFGLWAHLIRNCDVEELNDQSNFSAASKTRLKAILTLLRIVCISKYKTIGITYEELLESIIGMLLKRNCEESISRKRYFGCSSTHRVKQRISQALLVLQPLFTKPISLTVTTSLLESLAGDNPQPSVRYLMEWIIIRNLVSHRDLWNSFFEVSLECCRKREGFGSFFATICIHVCNLLDSHSSKPFYEKALLHLTELILGKHFTVRVYSQISFCKLYEKARHLGWNSMIEKFQTIYLAFDSSSRSAGNYSKIFQSINKDFYIKLFNAELHYNYKVIFIHLPRITGMANDELIETKILDQMAKLENLKNLKTCSDGMLRFDCDTDIRDSYIKFETSTWNLKAAADGRELGEESLEEAITVSDPAPSSVTNSEILVSNAGNFQRKINPWKFLPIVDEINNFPEDFQLKKKNLCDDGLIVVASLIDRVPNLGGLCRTCEIFGVSKYVISSMKVLEDQQFKNLSVSAHNWIEILEVPHRDLERYLTSYSTKGYSIIGIEQALESTQLNQYKFPKKSVLLLGNEKFGIPTNLLNLVDQCLEIPQVGVIRSLNVHVTGALCIWQYASQHIV